MFPKGQDGITPDTNLELMVAENNHCQEKVVQQVSVKGFQDNLKSGTNHNTFLVFSFFSICDFTASFLKANIFFRCVFCLGGDSPLRMIAQHTQFDDCY